MSPAVSGLLCWHGGESGAVSGCRRSKHWRSCWRGASWTARCPGRHRGPGRQRHIRLQTHRLELIESAVVFWSSWRVNQTRWTRFSPDWVETVGKHRLVIGAMLNYRGNSWTNVHKVPEHVNVTILANKWTAVCNIILHISQRIQKCLKYRYLVRAGQNEVIS